MPIKIDLVPVAIYYMTIEHTETPLLGSGPDSLGLPRTTSFAGVG
jgi:hypothetical protein